ncbi:hypothetical protein FHT87_002193 [Rhizobium sp. BK316]|uniref:hypothetical protein n=1 Tax=Rhizobium sp. BK316 TaxID=2587053 RepID=UPI00160F0BF4|nr:hypothetical protein [Rhizobium sp. BK316]MBB3408290.1 hypothetical protein [Rhizobium sp. BK316]
MSGAFKQHQHDSSAFASDGERIAAGIATMVAAVSDEQSRDMSDQEFAACEFEPWKHEEGEWTPPTNEQWARLANPHLIMVRVAWLTLHKTKEELIEMVEKMIAEEDGENNLLIATLDNLVATSDMFKGFLSICESAMARFMVAGMNIPDRSAV